MKHDIDVILFDVGGTLRGAWRQEEEKAMQALGEINRLMNLNMPENELFRLLKKGSKGYSAWAQETHMELDEEQLWSRWMLPDHPEQLVRSLAMQLNACWRQIIANREIFPETQEILMTLFRRGYRLGIVSNTTTSVEVPEFLRRLKLTGMLECVILSCQYGRRKPDPDILLEATRRMGVDPLQCAYIGDRLDRDVVAARAAGFRQIIILDGDRKNNDENLVSDPAQPDLYISNLLDLKKIFPMKDALPVPINKYPLSISTMWAIDNFPHLTDFLQASKRIGFEGVELNHQINSDMLQGTNLKDGFIASIHEPCPADISANDLKKRDWLISSIDEEKRQKGVDSIKRSVFLANKIGVKNIVVHCGQIVMDLGLEVQLRALYEKEGAAGESYQILKQHYETERARLARAHMDSLKKSIQELLQVAAPLGIRLALENRYHYFDLPLVDEMEELLALAGQDQLGFIYDVGHAQTLDRLGFVPHEEWLRRFSDRMVEIHIHDVKGIIDHYAPGLGEVDFDMIRPYLPAGIIRTVEIHPRNTPEELRQGINFLEIKGII